MTSNLSSTSRYLAWRLPFSLRRIAQYFRILSETAFLAAADIPLRRGRGPRSVSTADLGLAWPRLAPTLETTLPAIALMAARIALSSRAVAFSASRSVRITSIVAISTSVYCVN